MQFDPKKVAVLGGGHGAHCMAADLASRGFKVNMFEMPEFKNDLSQLFETKTIEIDGCIKGRYTLNKVTSDIHEAINGVRYILIVTPAFAHKAYANLLKEKIDPRNQTIILYPGAFAGLLFKTIFGDDCPVVAEANNLPYDIRLSLNNGGIPSFRFGYYGLRTTVRIKKCLNDSPSQYPSL